MIVISRFVTKNGFTVSQGRYIARTLSTEKKYVETTEKNGVRTIRLCDSSSRNSLSLGMLKTLVTEIKRDEDNKDLRSIVLMSEPGKVFSAGHNLKELTATNAKSHKDVFEICSELMRAISQSPVPVIAAVDGLAAAAGCQLVAACDIAVCTERSSFSTPGANVGIFCSTPGIPLVRNVPRKNAMYMLFTGFPISGKEAYECGLVSKVVANDKLDCGKMASIPQSAFAVCKVRYNEEQTVSMMKKKEKTEEKKENVFNPRPPLEGWELMPLKYNSKLMNSIWGLYNRYSVHNFKKNTDAEKGARGGMAVAIWGTIFENQPSANAAA
ncbi:PREDICTED: enoyl-CoA hydratase domain-containing protein 3, mitochondrial-like [Acromyrmex echinatior]|uniref:enoyl-CoA hydratase domain-containing protein 3, mitochondrial-like n=1 Tax=Acromyrmex echinatior TaxID=103372 RepID=UPI00058107E2|nr:PREDICTED: enoyl-CoA hydratase domain-containing protein 3, mitochondrial-like [Acromyrmex echinatior]